MVFLLQISFPRETLWEQGWFDVDFKSSSTHPSAKSEREGFLSGDGYGYTLAYKVRYVKNEN